ncbi:MAG: hypothetical protein ACE5HQ_06685 [Gemmatimonadota bacterium]
MGSDDEVNLGAHRVGQTDAGLEPGLSDLDPTREGRAGALAHRTDGGPQRIAPGAPEIGSRSAGEGPGPVLALAGIVEDERPDGDRVAPDAALGGRIVLDSGEVRVERHLQSDAVGLSLQGGGAHLRPHSERILEIAA